MLRPEKVIAVAAQETMSVIRLHSLPQAGKLVLGRIVELLGKSLHLRPCVDRHVHQILVVEHDDRLHGQGERKGLSLIGNRINCILNEGASDVIGQLVDLQNGAGLGGNGYTVVCHDKHICAQTCRAVQLIFLSSVGGSNVFNG